MNGAFSRGRRSRLARRPVGSLRPRVHRGRVGDDRGRIGRGRFVFGGGAGGCEEKEREHG